MGITLSRSEFVFGCCFFRIIQAVLRLLLAGDLIDGF